MIRFEHVTKRFGDGPQATLAVDDLSLDVASGEIVVLLGTSGCGKTTTLRMVNRLVEPTSGTITVAGRDVRAQQAHELRRHIGYVIQQSGLFPHRRVIDNITTVPRLLGWDRGRRRARAYELLELVGLDAAVARQFPGQLSGGQQQRVGVARALAADPPVLLMDEPFGAVDPVVRAQLQQQFLELQRRLGKTVLFVTHDVDEAIVLGSRIAVMRTPGEIAQIGTPAELLAAPVDDFVASFVGGRTIVHDADGRPIAYRTETPLIAFPGHATCSPRSAHAQSGRSPSLAPPPVASSSAASDALPERGEDDA